MKSKWLALLLAMALLLTMLGGCAEKADGNTNDEETETTSSATEEGAVTTTTTQAGNNGDGDIDYTTSYDKLPSEITLQKIAQLKTADSYGSVGARYKDESGKYGMVTYDGKHDTGAKYEHCEVCGDFFAVAETYKLNADDLSTINCVGVVDVYGKVIVPMEYAVVKKISDRYVQVIEATEQTDDEDDYLVYIHKGLLSMGAVEGDVLFKGRWYIYDVTTGKKVDGVTATNGYMISYTGDILTYVNDEGVNVKVDPQGKPLPQGADLFYNGWYAVTGEETGAVYTSDGDKLFEYYADEFVPSESTGDYIVACTFVDGEPVYVLLNTEGEIVSAEFKGSPSVYGELVQVDKALYTFDGKVVFHSDDSDYLSVTLDKFTEKAWIARDEDTNYLIDHEGEILWKIEKSDGITVSTTDFSVEKSEGGQKSFYSLKDKGFTITNGYYALAPWLVMIRTDDGTMVVDTISGKTLLSGYSTYSHIEHDGVHYIIASGNGKDIYVMK